MQKESLIKTTLQHGISAASINDSLSTARAKEPLPTLQTYCKSKTFIAHSGVNPLAGAASALFSLVHRLRTLESPSDIPALHQGLVHEIKAFECAAQTRGYRGDEILIARYFLCATFDEVIQTTSWGKACEWQIHHSILNVFQGEPWGGDRFFLILQKLQQEMSTHRDLLEFAYLCLSLGFQGRYRHSPEERDDLDRLVDDLYQALREQKEKEPVKKHHGVKPFRKFPPLMSKPLPLWLIGTLTFAVLATFYLGFNYVLDLTANPINMDLVKITTHHDPI